MTNYRIQLASNFQVVEFNLELADTEKLEIEDVRISEAVELVNKLGQVVENTIKTKDNNVKVTTAKMASEKQIQLMKKLHIANPTSYTMEEAQKLIKSKLAIQE